MKENTFIKSAYRTGAGTFLSRIIGYLRDMVIAAKFGAGPWADAFYVAFRIPNLLRNLFGEGTINSSFVPVFNEYLVKDKDEAWKFASVTFSVLAVILGLVVLFGMVFAPFIVRFIAPGFTYNSDKFSLTVVLTRIMFPFIFFISLAALSTAILNSMHIFFIPAVAPVMLSLGEIFSVFVIVPIMQGSVKGLAMGAVIGGLGQLIVQLPWFFKFLIRIKDSFRAMLTHPGFRKLLRLMFPAMLGVGIYQINIFVDTLCASYLIQGTPTALYYANRLVQLPLAIFGTSIATASLPMMSDRVAREDTQGLTGMLSSGLKLIIFLIMPCIAGLIFLGKPIIALLFQRGLFDNFATNLTYQALLFYSLGLISYAGVKVIGSVFYSLQDTKTPLKVAVIAMVVNIELNFILMRFLDIGGLALATAISSTLNFILLFILLKRRMNGLPGLKIAGTFWKTCVITIVVAAICYFFKISSINLFLKVGAGITVSLLAILGLAFIFKMDETKVVWQMFTSAVPTKKSKN